MRSRGWKRGFQILASVLNLTGIVINVEIPKNGKPENENEYKDLLDILETYVQEWFRVYTDLFINNN